MSTLICKSVTQNYTNGQQRVSGDYVDKLCEGVNQIMLSENYYALFVIVAELYSKPNTNINNWQKHFLYNYF
jgi:hypothetical protein